MMTSVHRKTFHGNTNMVIRTDRPNMVIRTDRPNMVIRTDRPNAQHAARKPVRLKRLQDISLRETNRRIRELIKVIHFSTRSPFFTVGSTIIAICSFNNAEFQQH